jgi:hypothetical protein
MLSLRAFLGKVESGFLAVLALGEADRPKMR